MRRSTRTTTTATNDACRPNTLHTTMLRVLSCRLRCMHLPLLLLLLLLPILLVRGSGADAHAQLLIDRSLLRHTLGQLRRQHALCC
jgi:hypothetical protein